MAPPGRSHRRRGALALLSALTLLARVAGADCRTRDEFDRLRHAITTTFGCERARLVDGGPACVPAGVPACAGTLVADILALTGTSDLRVAHGDRRDLSRQLRCQRSVARAIARFATTRLQSAASGITGLRADPHAAQRLWRLTTQCTVASGTTGDGHSVPRVGAPCDATLDAAAAGDARPLVDCLRRALGARIERAIRSSVKPSIVLILTDDQPATMMAPLANLQMDLVADRGVTFGRAVATTPLCGPSRASILTGRYEHNHGVFTNFLPNGFGALDDTSTIATWLHGAGYRTGLYGKYMNGYGGQVPPNRTGTTPYIPPGWDEWHALNELDFYNYHLIENDGVHAHGAAPGDYSTDVLAAKAVDFIRSSGNRPFLLYFAPYAPHDPATPAPRHAGSYAGVPPWRPPSYDEADVSDKATWLREDTPPMTPEDVAYADGIYPKMLESLRAVDDAIADIMTALRETGRDEDTLIVFTSDNGFALGEHRRNGKLCPYEECTRVPMVARYPRLDASPHVESRLVANIDLAPTFAELAGAAPASVVDGASLLPLLDGSATSWRTEILTEMPLGADVTPFDGVTSDRYSYVEYRMIPPLLGQEAELFDLQSDPAELESVAGDPAHHDVQGALAARLRELDPNWTQAPP